jgi:hypothetical protein
VAGHSHFGQGGGSIWMENVIEVPKWFLPLNSGTAYETIENSSIKFKKDENSGTNKVFNPKYCYQILSL